MHLVPNNYKLDLDFEWGKTSEVVLSQIRGVLAEISKSDITIDKKMLMISKVQGLLASKILQELLSEEPSVNFSIIASRASTIIRELSNTLVKQYELSLEELINTKSPKFKIIFSWFLQTVRASLHDNNVDALTVDSIFFDLSEKLSGWEEKLTKRLSNLSPESLAEEEKNNPFLQRSH